MRHGKRWLLAAAALLAAVAAVLALRRGPAPTPDPALFLDRHWQRPLPPQGSPPAAFTALEASLDPAACGQCHASQYADWRSSLHSRSMTAGILWQLRLLPQAEANQCLDCHAPLAEQKALLAREHGWAGAPAEPPPAYVPADLGHAGLTCAGCHVRRHQRFGPPPRPGVDPDRAPHGGFTVSAAFEDSRFCAACHQFPADGPRTAGKLREDTYEQWRASDFAARGVSCQSCHMPERRHLWRGVHTPEMVAAALTPALTVDAGEVRARLTNSGAGHHFPTYMVPKVYAQLVLIDAGGERVLTERVIGWQVDVSLQHEAFDTRLAPGASVELAAPLPTDAGPSARAELRVLVAPREHYERTFQAVLDQADKLDRRTLELLQQAYDEARASRYEALRLSVPLDPGLETDR
mgnify:FL=1